MYNSIHKNSSIFLFLIASFFIIPKQVKATHAAGGEITYQWISGSTYKINYIFYRSDSLRSNIQYHLIIINFINFFYCSISIKCF